MANQFIIDCSPYRSTLLELAASITDFSVAKETFFTEADLIADKLPFSMRQKLYDFHFRSNVAGIVLLTKMPLETYLPDTPNCGSSKQAHQCLSEKFLAMIGSRLGYIIAYRQEKNGALIQDIFPTKQEENAQSASGSLSPLVFHTEKHFHRHKPDYILLYCLRGDQQAQTYYINVNQILTHLNDKQRALLFTPVFRGGVDYSFGNDLTNKGNAELMPILYGHPQAPYLNCDLDLMLGTTPEAVQILDLLREVSYREKQSVCLNAGDLLILDNKYVAHGRSDFTPRYDGSDRWLQRVYIKTDLRAAAADRQPGSRVISSYRSSEK